MRYSLIIAIAAAALSGVANAQGLSSSDQQYLKEKIGFEPTAPVFAQMSSAQNQCVHLLITGSGNEAKRLKDLESYIGDLGKIYILHKTGDVKETVPQAKIPCPK